MPTSANPGPIIAYGQQPSVNGYVPDYNLASAPSLFWGGVGLLDSRWGYSVRGDAPSAIGFQGATNIPTINGIPSTASTSIIGAAQTPTTNVALVLATQSTTGLTVLSSAVTVTPSKVTIPVGALALDGLPGIVAFDGNPYPLGSSASGGGVQLYDPTKTLARTIRIQTNGADGSGSYLVTGNDVYGFPMTESIAGTTGATGSILLGKKAFKFVQSVLPRGTIASTSVSVGTADTFGLPLRSDAFGELNDVLVGNTSITVNTGYTASVTTSPATSSTGDVRGTYALQTVSNGTNVLVVYQSPKASNIGSITGLFGVTQA